MNRRLIATLPLLLLLAPELAPGAPARRTGRRGVVDGIAAQVDSVTILRTDVEEQSRMVAAQNNLNAKDATVFRKVKNEVLDRLVEEKVLAAEAHRQGVTVPESKPGVLSACSHCCSAVEPTPVVAARGACLRSTARLSRASSLSCAR